MGSELAMPINNQRGGCAVKAFVCVSSSYKHMSLSSCSLQLLDDFKSFGQRLLRAVTLWVWTSQLAKQPTDWVKARQPIFCLGRGPVIRLILPSCNIAHSLGFVLHWHLAFFSLEWLSPPLLNEKCLTLGPTFECSSNTYAWGDLSMLFYLPL